MYLPLGKFIQRYITTGNKITNISKLLNPATNDGLENLGKKGYDDLQDIVQNKLIQVTPENRSSLFKVFGTFNGILVKTLNLLLVKLVM